MTTPSRRPLSAEELHRALFMLVTDDASHDVVLRIKATIQDMAAREVALRASFEKAEDQVMYTAIAHDLNQEVDVCGLCDHENHTSECPFYILDADPSPAAKALAERLEKLETDLTFANNVIKGLNASCNVQTQRAEAAESNARTPGTVEVCEKCGRHTSYGPTCKTSDCPIRK